jgi:hypothetical protein
LDLQESLIPVPLIEHLAKVMPRDGSGEGYDYHAFLDTLVNGATNISVKSMSSDETRVDGGMARGSKHYL